MLELERPLIPLDGSDYAEGALPLAAAFRLGGADSTLLRVVDDEADVEAASRDLACLAGGAETRVRVGDPAAQILAEVERGGHGVVILRTRGRAGLQRWLRRSVAEQVLRRGAVPVLLGGPRAARSPGRVRRVLVPLAGEQSAAGVLPLVRTLCRATGAEAVLFTAVMIPPHDHVAAYSEELDAAQEAAEAELDTLAASLRRAGVRASSEVRVGAAAQEIPRVAAELGVDLIAMDAHGQGGVMRWLRGSVVEEVLRASASPVLLAPARVRQAAPARAVALTVT